MPAPFFFGLDSCFMDVRRALIFVTFGTFSLTANGQQVIEIYKCLESSGRYIYTNDKRETTGKKCEVVASQINVAPPSQKPAPKANTGSMGTMPKESPATRSSARDRQREILEGELQVEEQALAKAKQALAEQEGVRAGDEKNFAKVLERLQPLKDNVDLHEKNVAALKRELGNLYR